MKEERTVICPICEGTGSAEYFKHRDFKHYKEKPLNT